VIQAPSPSTLGSRTISTGRMRHSRRPKMCPPFRYIPENERGARAWTFCFLVRRTNVFSEENPTLALIPLRNANKSGCTIWDRRVPFTCGSRGYCTMPCIPLPSSRISVTNKASPNKPCAINCLMGIVTWSYPWTCPILLSFS